MRQVGSFLLYPQMGWNYFGNRLQWAVGLSLFGCVFVLRKLHSNTSAVTRAGSELPGKKVLSSARGFGFHGTFTRVLHSSEWAGSEAEHIMPGESRADITDLTLFHISR